MERVALYLNRSYANRVVVPGQPDRIIRVVQVVASCWEDWKFSLINDPEGSYTDLFPAIYCAKGVTFLRLGRRHSITTARGKSLGITTLCRTGEIEHAVMVWYDLVE